VRASDYLGIGHLITGAHAAVSHPASHVHQQLLGIAALPTHHHLDHSHHAQALGAQPLLRTLTWSTQCGCPPTLLLACRHAAARRAAAATIAWHAAARCRASTACLGFAAQRDELHRTVALLDFKQQVGCTLGGADTPVGSVDEGDSAADPKEMPWREAKAVAHSER
jgi:hypothetical protein